MVGSRSVAAAEAVSTVTRSALLHTSIGKSPRQFPFQADRAATAVAACSAVTPDDRVEGLISKHRLIGESKEKQMSQYAPGDRVAHHQYGDGTVQSVNEYHTVIDFDAHGRRTFSSPRVVLAASSTPAPVKPVRRKRQSASSRSTPA